MITRREYMADSKNLHRVYYGQFITEEMPYIIKQHIGLARLLASKDECFNDISIYKWDAMLYSMYDRRTNKKLRAKDASIAFGNNTAYYTIWHFDHKSVDRRMRWAEDNPSLAGYVCTFKECARQMVERYERENRAD